MTVSKQRLFPYLERNVDGPFYTTGQCVACEQPEAEAPDLLAPLDDENLETFFRRQPTTAEEIERACRAAEVCCLGALRYGGRDRRVIRRLGNSAEYCDYVIAWWGGLVPSVPYPKWWEFWRRAGAT